MNGGMHLQVEGLFPVLFRKLSTHYNNLSKFYKFSIYTFALSKFPTTQPNLSTSNTKPAFKYK